MTPKSWHVFLGCFIAYLMFIMMGLAMVYDTVQPAYTVDSSYFIGTFVILVIPFGIGVCMGREL